jgi:hypothetical protein
LDSAQSVTLNDFYDRPVTYANIPKLPWPIKEDVSKKKKIVSVTFFVSLSFFFVCYILFFKNMEVHKSP